MGEMNGKLLLIVSKRNIPDSLCMFGECIIPLYCKLFYEGVWQRRSDEEKRMSCKDKI
jgi:hypothetical protein